jgi:hypothetical protein
MPHEFVLGEVYLPPLLVVAAIAYILSSVVTVVGIKLGWYKHVVAPALVELCLFVIFGGLLGLFLPIF